MTPAKTPDRRSLRRCLFVLVGAASLLTRPTQGQEPCTANAIVCENQLTGNLSSEWDISGAGDSSIQGFPTDISVNKGETVHFKITTTAPTFRMDIYRLGYYGGRGARKVASLSDLAGRNQAACLTDNASGLVDCGNWLESASWPVPSTAVSGIYIARIIRNDTNGASHIAFVVRDDAAQAALLFQTSDTTWTAYNRYGGNSFYVGGPGTNPGRAYKVSYNRPITTRGTSAEDWIFNAEYPMLRWLEANGYDMSYSAGVDTDRHGATELLRHRVFISVGHDEYWSGQQRANVEAARNGGVNLAFFSGNEMFWKTRWETSIDGTHTPYRTLVSYKESLAPTSALPLDPLDPPTWTGLWRDGRMTSADGGRPENAVTGTMQTANCCTWTAAIKVSASAASQPFWRNTRVANLTGGQTTTITPGTLGYEWDEDLNNGFRPAGLIDLSSATFSIEQKTTQISDGSYTVLPGTATHSLTLYRHSSGALVFGAGTVQYSWALDSHHDRDASTPDVALQQATVNLLSDMGVEAGSLQPGLVPGAPVNDTQAPTSIITNPSPGASFESGSQLVISGTASDVGGGQVARVEVSTDGGAIWKPAAGTAPWTYAWTPTTIGSVTLRSRATDTSGNVESPSAGVSMTVTAPACGCAATVAIDAIVSVDGTGPQITAPFSTSTAGTLVLAFVAADGPSAGGQTATVSGAGLVWSLVRRVNTQAGTSDIWKASAANVLSNVTVTSTTGASGYPQSLTVIAFTGAGGTGASAGASAASGAPAVSLTTTQAGSVVYGVGNDWDNAVARTPGTGQSIVHEFLAPLGDTFWVQVRTSPTAAGGTVASLNATAPTTDRWNLAAVEVLPGTLQDPPPPSNFSVDGSTTLQPIDGFGVNINPKLWNNGELIAGINQLVDLMGVDMARVDALATSRWELANDNADPFTYNWTYYNALFGNTNFESVWKTIEYLHKRNVAVILSASGVLPAWMGGSTLDVSQEDEFAEMFAAAVYYARNTRGLAFTLVDPMNEVDWNGLEGPQLSAEQYARVVRKIVDRFAALGLDDIRVVPPGVANVSSTSYVDALLADSTVMAHVDQWGFHNYFGVSPALTSGQLAGRRLWLTEWSNATTDGWLDTGQDVANEWTFAETEADYLLNHLRDNASAALKWDAIDNVHEHDPSGAVSKWGALAYDFATQTMTPRKRLYTSAQVFRFVRPGMGRVGVSSSVSNLIAYAFYDPASGRFALVGHNQGAGSATLNASLASVGSPTLLQAYTTNAASASVTRGSDVPVSGGSFSYSVPADTFFTLTTPVPAADSVVPSVSLVSPAGGDSLSGLVDVVAAATDNDAVAAVQFLLDGRPLAAMMTEPYATVLDTRVLANGAHTIAAAAWDRTGNTSTATITVGVNNSTSRDLVAAYGFNETSGILGADISGNGHAGFLNGPTWTTAGKYGGALSFSGQSLLIVNDSQDLHLANGMTLEAWVRPSTSAGSQAVLLKERPGDVSYALYSAVSGGAGQAQVTDAVLTRKTSTTGTLPLNTWTYLAVTYDGTSLRAYVNGTLSGTVAAGAIFSTNNPLFIGGSAYRGDFFSGLIDEVRIYNRALSPVEIAADMATPVVTDAAPPTVQLTAPPAGATVSGGAVSIAANASDDIGVVGVQFQIDGVNLGGQDSTAPYGTTWDSRTVANGTHVVTAIAKDAADKTGTSSVSVAVANPPTISAVSAGSITGTSAIVSWTTNVPATSQVAFGPTAAYGSVTLLDEALVISHAQTLTGLSPATRYHYQALSTDAGGNSVASADFTFTTVDTVFPAVSLTAPIDGATVSGPSVTVSADAFDNVGIVGVQFKVDGANLGAEDQTSPYSVVWNTTGAANGPHTLTAAARDASGNVTASAPVSVTVANVAKAISVNFLGGSPTTTTVAMGSTEIAGVVARTNWNNATGASRSTALALVDETGGATAATLTWASDNTWVLPVADQAGSRRMMRGYLDTGSLNPATVTVAGLAAGAYDIYVYGDGDNGSATRSGTYRLSGPGLTATSIGLTDAANTNFNATFTQAAGTNGNYVKFSGVALTSGFTITATPGTATDPYRRAPVNGLQIVPTAPPSPDFTVSATPSSRTIVIGAATTYTVSVGALNGFAAEVALGVSGLPANTTAAFDPPTLTGSGSATLTVTTTTGTPSSTSTVTVTGTSGTLQHSTTVSLVVTPPPDFTLAATPSGATTVPGGSVSYTVTIGALNGFAGVVSLGVSGLPAGAGASFAPASVTGSGTSTLTVTTGASTPIGGATLTVTGTSGALTHSAAVALTLNAAGTGAISVNFVGTGTAMGSTEIAGVVARARWNNATGASRTSALALMDETGAPTTAGLTWSANATSRTPITDSAGNNRMMRGYLDTSNTSVTSVNVTGLAGTYDVYVYVDGNNGTASRTGSYRLSGAGITTTTITLTDAASTNFNGTFVQAVNSSGNYVKFAGVSITSGFTITATPGTASTSTRRAPINGLQLVPAAPPAPDFTVAVAPASRAIDPGGATSFAIDLGALNGFAGAVSLGVSGVPSGVAAAFNPNPAEAAGAGSATLTITTTTPAPGSSTLTITGTAGALTHTATATLVVNAPPGSARTISVNFVGGSPTTTTVAMGSTESAGVVSTTSWNNATGASRSTALALVDDTGAATAATLTWASDNTWVLPVADQAGSRRMMRGYLDTGSLNPTTVTVAALAAGAYDIYVYADGDNGGMTRSATYQLSGPGLTATSLGLTDAANTNFTATFTQAAGSNGNYVKFSGVALISGFTITATPGTSTDPYRRAPINGLQIVPVGAMPTAWNLSGNISPASGGNGSMVTLTGTVSATTTADASGNYVFTGLPSGSYTVTPIRNSETLLQAWATPRTGVTTNKIAPYPANASTASPGNCCTQQGTTTESWIQLGSLYQIRQTGSITSIRFGWGTASSGSVTGLYFTVWRSNSAGTFDLVAESQNLAGSVSSGSVNTIGLTPPLAVREGDYYGMRQVGSLPSNHLNIVNATLGNLFYTTATPSSPFAWLSQSSMGVGRAVIVDVYMSTGPNFVTPSNSWFSGTPDTFSGCDTAAGGIWNPASNVNVTIAHYLAEKLTAQTGLAFSFDNCSITGDQIVNIALRYGSDALSAGPRFAVLAGGWNDIWYPYTQSQFHNAWNAILAANQAAGITSIVMLLEPITSATNAQHMTADAWNADLKALVQNSYPSAILFDVSPYIGQFRSGGPAGNRWDIQPGYDSGDLTHVNPAGKERVAQAIDDAIVAYASVHYTFSPASRSVAISGADVTGVNFSAVPGS